MKNNKGQALVVFIIFIPVMFLLVTSMINYGTALSEKKKIDSTIREVIEYGFSNSSDPEIEDKILLLIQNNVKDTQNIIIDVRSNTITITLTKKISFINQDEETEFKYIGTKDINNKISIEEE